MCLSPKCAVRGLGLRDNRHPPIRAGKFNNQAGQDACQNCPEGQYMDVQGITNSCKSCVRGMYTNLTGQVLCTGCGFGPCTRAWAFTGLRAMAQKSLHYLRNAGRYGPAEALVNCLQCEAGTFQDVPSQDGCSACPIGRFQAEDGRSLCVDCPANFYSAESADLARTACTPCATGTYSAARAAHCLSCTFGMDEATGEEFGVDMSGDEQISVDKCIVCSGAYASCFPQPRGTITCASSCCCSVTCCFVRLLSDRPNCGAMLGSSVRRCARHAACLQFHEPGGRNLLS